VDDDGDDDDEVNDEVDDEIDDVQHGILFKISGETLVPFLGDDDDDFDHSGVEIQAGKSMTLKFSGVIRLSLDDDDDENSQITVYPVSGNVYSMRPLGNGLELYEVTAS
jgi:hypothetical protein